MTTLHTVAATGALKLSWLLLVFPLFGAVVLLIGGRRTNRWGHLLGVAMPVAAFVVRRDRVLHHARARDQQRSQDVHLYSWIPVAGFQVNMDLLVDQLSICFVLLITGVGSLIIIYSVGYMSHDPERRRFFGYMNLFLAAMLLLVLGDNYLVLYAGWEGVGLAVLPADRVLLLPALGGGRGEEGVHRQPGRRRRLSLAIMLMFAEFGTVSFTGCLRRGGPAGVAWRRRSGCCSCSARAASPPRCRCSPGCSTRWRARPRCRR